MRLLYISVFVSFCNVYAAINTHEGNALFDYFKQNIQNARTEKNKQCMDQLIVSVERAQNFTLGGSWLWDSIQLPTGVLYGSRYQLGNYDQCLNPPWGFNGVRTKYCLADVTLTDQKPAQATEFFHPNDSTGKFMNTLSKYNKELNMLTWGICVPASCDPKAVVMFIKILLRHSSLSAVSSSKINVESCEASGEVKPVSAGYYAFWCLIGSLVIVAMLSTYCTNYVYCENQNGKVAKLFKAFSVNDNAFSLVKRLDGEIPSMYGMRSLTTFITVLAHYIMYATASPTINSLDVDKDLDNIWIYSHITIVIETFYFLSGLLFMKTLVSKKDKPENPFVVLLKRYLRFFGVLAVVIWYMLFVLEHKGSGPLWNRLIGREVNYCTKNWLLTMLMINNYINAGGICHLLTWYISTDFQLSILTVIFFYCCLKRGDGRNFLIFLGICGFIAPGLATYWYKWPAELLIDVKSLRNLRDVPLFTDKYVKTHYRLSSYLLGITMGYLLSIYKPSHNRNIISRVWAETLIFLSGITMQITISTCGIFYHREYNLLEAVLYASTNRTIWALCIAVIVIASEYGEPCICSQLLSWPAWVPLSRLSFGVYLIHPLVIFPSLFVSRAPATHSAYSLFMNALGAVVLAFLASFCLWILVEAPLNNLTNWILKSESTKMLNASQQNEVKTNGSVGETEKRASVGFYQFHDSNESLLRQRRR